MDGESSPMCAGERSLTNQKRLSEFNRRFLIGAAVLFFRVPDAHTQPEEHQ
jgi:hypothetical protein